MPLTNTVCDKLTAVLNNAPLNQTWAIIVGFLAGIGLFLLLGYILGKLEDAAEDEEDSEAGSPKFVVPNYGSDQEGHGVRERLNALHFSSNFLCVCRA